MPTQSCVSMRPGTIFGYQGEAWKVIFNDTLNHRFQARRIEPGTHGTTKTFNYTYGQEIQVRWVPSTSR